MKNEMNRRIITIQLIKQYAAARHHLQLHISDTRYRTTLLNYIPYPIVRSSPSHFEAYTVVKREPNHSHSHKLLLFKGKRDKKTGRRT